MSSLTILVKCPKCGGTRFRRMEIYLGELAYSYEGGLRFNVSSTEMPAHITCDDCVVSWRVGTLVKASIEQLEKREADADLHRKYGGD